MPPRTTLTPTQLEEISRLNVRLSIARSKRGPLLQTLDELKSQLVMECSELNKFQQQINQSQAAANTARSQNRMTEYEFYIQLVNEKNWARQRCLSQWEELGKKLENSSRELRNLEVEISELGRMMTNE